MPYARSATIRSSPRAQPRAHLAAGRFPPYRALVATSPQDVHTITGAQRALSDEQTSRTRKYLLSMGIRTACVLGAIIVPGWPRWVLIAGAVVLPYFAVVIANAGKSRDRSGDLGVVPQPQAALPASGAAIEGVIVEPDRSDA
ncbi:MAG: DUF3099 domain-containing protein [Actinobacteria bacterium]|nr:DUF3099 domain-containing protein [Actinomycetota bacterium]